MGDNSSVAEELALDKDSAAGNEFVGRLLNNYNGEVAVQARFEGRETRFTNVSAAVFPWWRQTTYQHSLPR